MSNHTRQGLILIPDITGYTSYIHHAELGHAQRTITRLLEAIMGATQLELRLCEIEGDALLYFRVGELPSFAEISDQVQSWSAAFHVVLQDLSLDHDCKCGACNHMQELTLKVVGHYGEFGFHKVGDAHKLIGKDVILTHRLLKNSLDMREYFLFTPELVQEDLNGTSAELGLVLHEEQYEVFGNVPLLYLPINQAKIGTAAPPVVLQS